MRKSNGAKVAPLPRLHRRGLIEAPINLPPLLVYTHFRAFTGAVSLKLSLCPDLRCVSLDFRAFTGAVSLKPTLRPSFHIPHPNFRAFTGAVSLKRRAWRSRRDTMGQLPRLHRRGLIEADFAAVWTVDREDNFRAFTGAVSLKQHSTAAESNRRTYFRAFTGAVSLKHQYRALVLSQYNNFRAFTGAVSLKLDWERRASYARQELPRLHRRGLIEAKCTRPPSQHRKPNFRAFTGAVSLKQTTAIHARGEQRDFRAFTGAVSLKRRGLAFPLHFLRLLPRLHRRGLIEAKSSRSPAAAARDFRAFTGAVSLKQRRGELEGVFLRRTSAPSQARSH